MNPHKPRKTTFSLRDRNPNDLAYLLRRAGFGSARADPLIASAPNLGALVNTLVDYEQVVDTFAPPPDAILTYKQMGGQQAELSALSAWWVGQMISSSRPLREKMTLFWHGHFATGFAKVRSTLLMYRQNQLFRQNALGRFDDLLSVVYKDPAMLIWLDGERNVKQAPNENWAREVMELFALGHGNYTEDDIHAAAKAFTGWRLNQNGDAVFVPRLHDTTVKTVLGQTGNWDGEDVVRILAAHPVTGTFLATKLWRFFASDQPPSSVIRKLAQVYYDSNHSVREMVRTLFTMPEFYAPAVRMGHIKSPVEFVVTTIRQLGFANVDPQTLPRTLTFLGQELFNPPNVGGWPGGSTWINAATMLGRFNFASFVTGDDARKRGVINPDAILAAGDATSIDAINRTTGAEVMESLALNITDTLGIPLTGSTRKALLDYAGRGPLDTKSLDTKIRGLVHLAMVSPEYQAS